MRCSELWMIVVLGMSFLVIGCDRNPPPPSGDASAAPPHHEHKPPHGGTLVELGEEFSHLELILDAREGRLTGFALDGEAENPVRLKQEEIVVKIHAVTRGDGEKPVEPPLIIHLKAVASPLSGETVGDSSEFAARSDSLKGVTHFQAEIEAILIKGQEFKNVSFAFPEGNDEHAK